MALIYFFVNFVWFHCVVNESILVVDGKQNHLKAEAYPFVVVGWKTETRYIYCKPTDLSNVHSQKHSAKQNEHQDEHQDENQASVAGLFDTLNDWNLLDFYTKHETLQRLKVKE